MDSLGAGLPPPIRDYIKWDDAPTSLQSFNESLVRAHKIATTPPQGPVAIVADSMVQEAPAGAARNAVPRPSRRVRRAATTRRSRKPRSC